jgi:hypothetical protein
VKEGQQVEVEFDALAGTLYHGTVKNVGGMSTHMFWEMNNGGDFNVTVQVTEIDSRLRPGFTAHVAVLGDLQKNVLYVPRQATYLKDGKRIVYVRSGGTFEAREIKIKNENESRAAMEGLAEGTEVALVDPTVARKAQSSTATSTGGGAP